MYGIESMTFNIHGGYLEAIVRGYRSGLLTAADYNNLCQCETLEDIKMHLTATEYGPFLQNGEPVFGIWRLLFSDLDDMNIEIMRNTLYKAYLEDFYQFCKKLGSATSEIMCDLLAFEADRRAVNITINSIGTELTRDDRRKLYSNFGLLYPYGHEELAVCEDFDQVRAVLEKYPPYRSIFSKLSYGESQMLDKAFYEEEVKRLCLAFEQQFHYAVFFAYIRLREQEIRNLMWISECVAQNQKSRVHDSVVFIF